MCQNGVCTCGRRHQRTTQAEADDERSVLLLNGTTNGMAALIKAQQFMPRHRTFFALGWSNRDLARQFALRAHAKRPNDGGPAMILVSVPESVLNSLRSQGLLRALPFDTQDRPEFRNRRQWVAEPGGIDLLNRGALRFASVPVKPAVGLLRRARGKR